MAFGVDYVSGPLPTDLKAAGVTFVCRYLSYVNNLTQVKLLTNTEAKALSEAGISIVSNYEWYASRATEGFASGVQDAQIAVQQHEQCGGPPDRPIYFSVDENVAGDQCADYFKGVASVSGLARTGAYGSFRVLQYLFNEGLIKWGWQTYAWSGGAWEPRAHIRQTQNGMTLAGHSVDYDESQTADFGQWMQGEAMLQLTDPMGKYYVNVPDTNGTRWHCPSTGYDIAYALLDFYRQRNGEYGLIRSGEIYLQQYPGTAIQYTERAIMAYDPEHVIDNPPGAGACYLLHIDAGIGQQAIAKPLLAALTAQVSDLQAQITTLQDELSKAGDTSALQAQIADLTTKLASAKQAVVICSQAVEAL